MCAFSLLTTWSSGALADYPQARSYFESLSSSEQAEIVLGLIGTGDFVGLIDYGFTKRLYRSILAFEQRSGALVDGMITPSERNLLSREADRFYTETGADWVRLPETGSDLLVPLRLFDTQTTTDHGLAYERSDKNLSLSFFAYPRGEKTFEALYEKMSEPTERRQISYNTLKTNYFVVSGAYRGRNFYTWVSRIQGGSSGFTLAWSGSWDTMGGKLSILLANSFMPLGRKTDATTENQPRTPAPTPTSPEPPPRSEEARSGTGTGFRVSPEGHVLTNYHVAGKCRDLAVRRPGDVPAAASLVASDETNDLAVIKISGSLSGTVAKFHTGVNPKAGSDVVVYGFPLASILGSSGNVVTGNITSLAGLGNNSGQYQISAPVQPGNSGGPVLDREGRVVGVVVSKLDALKTAEAIGDIPQNVNFAIKSSVAMNFLDGSSITYQAAESGTPLDTPSLAELAQGFTYLVECKN
ncbi:S1 family peptidase [Aestuariivirga litoralis]|uniref:S1 family peptidase n=1 Tax=Aestuariivirga litoralis TaxID=2650924 RepID=UPI0013799512|nr:serine protease [Aestuariivirga litoralis]